MRCTAGEYYGRPLELLRHWESVNGQAYLGMNADEVYAYGVSFGYDAMIGKFGLNEMLGGGAAPGANFGTNISQPTDRPDENIGALIDGMALNPTAAKLMFEGNSWMGGMDIDWKNSSTGDANMDAQISNMLGSDGKFYVEDKRTCRMGNMSSTISLGKREVSIAGWLAAHVSQASAANFLANYVGDKASSPAMQEVSFKQASGKIEPINKNGKKIGLSFSGALFGGIGYSFGVIQDAKGNTGGYFTFNGVIGFGGGINIDVAEIKPGTENKDVFLLEHYEGTGASWNFGASGPFGAAGVSVGGNLKRVEGMNGVDMMNWNNFGTGENGYMEGSGSFWKASSGFYGEASYKYGKSWVWDF